MTEYHVWTDVTEKQTIKAHEPREAAAKYHELVGKMPDKWDGTLFVRDESNKEEWTYRRRAAA